MAEPRAGSLVVAAPPLPEIAPSPELLATPVPTREAPPERHPYHEPIPPVSELSRGVAQEYANLSPGECARRLKSRGLPFRRAGATSGVATPLRFSGALGEVQFLVPPDKSPFGLIDCRLALVLSELVPLLRRHEVKAVRIDNFYRPGARLPTKKSSKSQHAHALAADVVSVTLDDGTLLDVERDFHGERGRPVCGPDAYLEPPSLAAVRLRNLTCELARSGAFHHVLTPNYDVAHRNHLHLDIKRDYRWFSVQ